MAVHVAIVGGGFSGTMLAVQLLRRGARVTLIERGAAPGRGLAYGAADPIHLLNVRSGNMSAYPDEPGHLVDWLEARGVENAAPTFTPRRIYGSYVEEQLAAARAAAPERIEIIGVTAEDLEQVDDTSRLRLADGREIVADAVVLALGNLRPPPPPGIDAAGLEPGRFWSDPWVPGVSEGLDPKQPVLVVGTGLTMVDLVLLLEARGFTGPIHAISRRGLIPQAHATEPPPAERREAAPATTASELVRDVRLRSRVVGWRHAVDELRPFTQAMWRAATPAQRGRFLRHLRPWWDVHRHRIAPEVSERIHAMIGRGQLHVAAGKLLRSEQAGEGVRVHWRPRGSDSAEAVDVQRIVNCTGPEGNLPRSTEPLLRRLLERRAIRPGPCGIGVDVDAEGRVLKGDGTADPRLWALGPLTRGAFWEIVAVPDIRGQVRQVAGLLSEEAR